MKKKIIRTLNKFLYKKDKSLHSPYFTGNEKKYLINCINTTFVSSVGNYVTKFENKLKNYTGSDNAVALINGSSALLILLKALNIGKDNEVLIPSLTFIATANAVKIAGAEPIFVDINKNNFSICPEKLDSYLKEISFRKNGKTFNKKTGKHIKGLILVYLFGFAENINKIKKVCNKYNILMMEDAAEGIGSFYKNKHLGNFGIAGVISFNGNKTITCGNGAVLLTKNKKLAEKVRHLSINAKIKHQFEYIHDSVGFNFRLSNVNAAIGCAQIEKINKIISLKRGNFLKYKKLFSKFHSLEIVKEPKNCKSNYWLINLNLGKYSKIKQNLLKELNTLSIKARPIWKPLHLLKPFKKSQRDTLTNTLKVYNCLISLPSSPSLNKK